MRMSILIVLLFSIAAGAQTLTVKDRLTHQALEHVNLFSPDSLITATTDAKGKADISAFHGMSSIHARRIGYQPVLADWNELESGRFILYMDEQPILMNEVVVAAVRWQQLKRDVQNRVTIIRPIQIQLQNTQTAADLLSSSGEVFIQKSQLGGGSPMIRGFATNRVLIAVDGVRMNNAIFRSGNLQNVISLDPLAIEKTEVVFGPGSLMYGSDAIGGVMSFSTLEPRFSSGDSPLVKGSALLRTSSADFEKTGHADVMIGLKKWSFLTSATYTDYDDLIMGSSGPDDFLRPNYVKWIDGKDSMVVNENEKKQVYSGYDQFNFMQKIHFRPSDSWDFQYGFHHSGTSDVPRYDRLTEAKSGKLRRAEWYYGPQIWDMHSLSIQHAGSGGIAENARLILAYQFFEESRHERNFRDDLFRHRTENVDAFSANLDLAKSLGQKHDLYYGVELLANRVGSEAEEENIATEDVGPTSTRYPDGTTWNSYAAYFNYRYKPDPKWILQGGLRYSLATMDAEFDTTFFPFPFTSANLSNGALTGSGGVVLHPGTGWEFAFNLSTGFRAPNVDDLGKVFDSEPGSVVVPNPDLKPEYAVNAELGAAKVFGEWLNIDAAVYYTRLKDAMVRRDFTLNGQDSVVYDGTMSRVQAIQNAAEAFVWGVQAGIEIKLAGGFGLLSRFNYQKGEEELDDGSTAPLRHAGPWFGSTHLTFQRNRWKTDLYAVYNGEIANQDLAPEEQGKPYLYAKDGEGNPYSPGWWTLNFKCLFRLGDHWMLSGGVENILDRRYRPYSSGIASPGRNFILSLRTGF